MKKCYYLPIIWPILSIVFDLMTPPKTGNRLLITPNKCSTCTLALDNEALNCSSLLFCTASWRIGVTRIGLHWKPESPEKIQTMYAETIRFVNK